MIVVYMVIFRSTLDLELTTTVEIRALNHYASRIWFVTAEWV